MTLLTKIRIWLNEIEIDWYQFDLEIGFISLEKYYIGIDKCQRRIVKLNEKNK